MAKSILGLKMIALLFRVVSVVIALQFGGVVAATAQRPSSDSLEVTSYVNGYWWTPDTGFEYGERAVQNGVFVPPDLAPATQIIDLEGRYVIPPLGDAHSHTINTPDGPFGVDVMVERFRNEGVFYVKNPNAFAPYVPGIRRKLNQPDSVDVTFAMGGITAPGGHPGPLYTQTLSNILYEGYAPEEFEGLAYHTLSRRGDITRALDLLEIQGADFVKIYLLFSSDRQNSQGLSAQQARRIVEHAHERGLAVTAHIETADDFRAAIAAGVDEIAHLPGYAWREGLTADDYRLTAADAQAAATAGVVVVTTTIVTRQFYQSRPGAAANVQALQADNLNTLYEAGVALAIGSDDLWSTARSEIDNLRRIGAFDDQTLLRLWINTPKVSIFPDREVSCLDLGCEGSFLVLQDNPLDRFEALETITLAVKEGHHQLQ